MEMLTAKDVSWRVITTSQVLTVGDCYLLYVLLISTSEGASDAVIYDGVDTVGDKRLPLLADLGGKMEVCPPYPLPYYKGIYASLGSNVNSLLVAFLQNPEVCDGGR